MKNKHTHHSVFSLLTLVICSIFISAGSIWFVQKVQSATVPSSTPLYFSNQRGTISDSSHHKNVLAASTSAELEVQKKKYDEVAALSRPGLSVFIHVPF